MTAALKAAVRLASVLRASKSDGDRTLKVVLYGTAAGLSLALLLTSFVVSVITAPFEYEGVLGELQDMYAYLIPAPAGMDGDVETDKDGGTADYAPPADYKLSEERQTVLETGMRLVGKVGYFWGGKSDAGWNDAWGSARLVTASGSRTTGSYQKYGLDCSGYTSWVFKTANIGGLGNGTSAQWSHTRAIEKDELLPGDLAFLQKPSASGTNHVGIYAGVDSHGKMLFLHCAVNRGVVLNTYGGFRYYRRVPGLGS